MRDSVQEILDIIRSKSRAEWQQWCSAYIAEVRAYVRDQGERAALMAFGLGILLVIFYRLVIIIACVVLVLQQLAFIIADAAHSDTAKHDDNSHDLGA